MKKCSDSDMCPSCIAARSMVERINAIFRPDEKPHWGWALVRFSRFTQRQAMDREMARRAALVPKIKASGIEGPGRVNECSGTWLGMGTDDAGNDRDIDANGWYSNARRALEESEK